MGEFNVHHPKWQLCCCRIDHGMQIVAGAEIAAGIIGILASGSTLVPNDTMSAVSTVTSVLLSVSFIIAAVLLIVGVQLLKPQLLYAHFGVSLLAVLVLLALILINTLLPHANLAKMPEERKKEKATPKVTTFLLSLCLMAVVAVLLLYLVYLTAKCIRFVTGSRRLEERRLSRIVAEDIANVMPTH